MIIKPFPLYTLKEVAKKSGYCVTTINRKIRYGTLKALKVGGRWKVSEQDLQKFLKKKKINGKQTT
jgi:excisionase family DNA binding protein